MNASDEYDDLQPQVFAPGSQWVSFDDLSDAARIDACVLFTGNQDAVQRLAYLVHTLSGWRHGPFAVADCGGDEANIARLLREFSEGAEPARVGSSPHARLAQAGTVLLHEIGRLSAPTQALLADVLGGTRAVGRRGRMRRRLMASSSEPLLPRVRAGTFDDQLFYRLNVIHLVVPDDSQARLVRRIPLDSKGAIPDPLTTRE